MRLIAKIDKTQLTNTIYFNYSECVNYFKVFGFIRNTDILCQVLYTKKETSVLLISRNAKHEDKNILYYRGNINIDAINNTINLQILNEDKTKIKISIIGDVDLDITNDLHIELDIIAMFIDINDGIFSHNITIYDENVLDDDNMLRFVIPSKIEEYILDTLLNNENVKMKIYDIVDNGNTPAYNTTTMSWPINRKFAVFTNKLQEYGFLKDFKLIKNCGGISCIDLIFDNGNHKINLNVNIDEMYYGLAKELLKIITIYNFNCLIYNTNDNDYDKFITYMDRIVSKFEKLHNLKLSDMLYLYTPIFHTYVEYSYMYHELIVNTLITVERRVFSNKQLLLNKQFNSVYMIDYIKEVYSDIYKNKQEVQDDKNNKQTSNYQR